MSLLKSFHANLKLRPYVVGFHRYVIENFTSNSLDEMKVHEVEEFDAPSEVGILGN